MSGDSFSTTSLTAENGEMKRVTHRPARDGWPGTRVGLRRAAHGRKTLENLRMRSRRTTRNGPTTESARTGANTPGPGLDYLTELAFNIRGPFTEPHPELID